MSKIPYGIDRKTASKLLGVSVRTIDRYIRNGRLMARENKGRIWLDKAVLSHVRKYGGDVVKPLRIATKVDRAIQTPIGQNMSPTTDSSFYRDLYEATQKALRESQQRLEQSTYRIGQLESQMLQHAPIQKSFERIDRIERDDPAVSETLRKDILDREKEIFTLKELAKRERLSRIIFAVLTYILLILQPVFWYLLR